ncbi:unnamed protein product [Trypanosoma congolense IL3000]|uniref:WGS project CAEQ00000000 data, annotated contig 13 n=1 Tax=Trypanosoma congolense (strain IL3000) TaxID=1068625 RepID=F9W5V8_TRYCI|nr:unnamed protein product [Trypanosoma congolense IL3000]
MNGMPSGEKSLGTSPSLKFATPAEPCVSPSRQASPNGSLLNTTSLQSTSLDVGSERLVYLGLYPDLGFGDGVSVCPPPLQRFRPNNVRCPAFENARRSNPTNQRPHTFSPGQLPPKPKDTPRGVRFDFADTHRSPSLSVNRHVPSDVKGGGRYIHPHPPPRKQHRETTYMDPRSEMSCESQLHTPLKRYTKNARLPKVQAPFSSRCSLPSSNIDRQHLCSEPRSRSLFNATQSIDESNWSRPFTQDSHPSNRRTRLGSAISTPCSTRAMGSSTNTVRRLGEIASKMANAHLSCPQIHRTPLVRSEARASPTHPREPTTLHAVYRDTSR